MFFRYEYPLGPVCDWPSNVNCTNDTPCDINLVECCSDADCPVTFIQELLHVLQLLCRMELYALEILVEVLQFHQSHQLHILHHLQQLLEIQLQHRDPQLQLLPQLLLIEQLLMLPLQLLPLPQLHQLQQLHQQLLLLQQLLLPQLLLLLPLQLKNLQLQKSLENVMLKDHVN